MGSLKEFSKNVAKDFEVVFFNYPSVLFILGSIIILQLVF